MRLSPVDALTFRRNPAIGLPPRDSITREDYPAIFGDHDADGYLNVDDPDPFAASDDSIEQIRLASVMGNVIDERREFVAAKDTAMDLLRAIGGPQARVYGRVKSPFAILNKLVKKRWQTLTDTAATMLVVPDFASAKKARKAIEDNSEVLEIEDFYATPNNGYRAFHYIISIDGEPVEVQLKTARMKALSEASHEAYKRGSLDGAELNRISLMAHAADQGDMSAAAQIDEIIADTETLSRRLGGQ